MRDTCSGMCCEKKRSSLHRGLGRGKKSVAAKWGKSAEPDVDTGDNNGKFIRKKQANVGRLTRKKSIACEKVREGFSSYQNRRRELDQKRAC